VLTRLGCVLDTWQRLVLAAEENPAAIHLPDDGDLLLPASVWQAAPAAVRARPGKNGLWLEPDDALDALAAHLGDVALIALHFPRFTDGRPYSLARRLRQHYGYAGELRATGDVLVDQLYYQKRVGFDAWALRADQDPNAALGAFASFSVAYQPACDTPLPLFRRRLA
jgi:uncharacterized protein (DUF934 family)